MANDYLLYEKIDMYLKGKLSEEEFYAFEIQLKKDDALKELLETQRVANQMVYVKQLVALQTKMQSDLKAQKRWQNYRLLLLGGLIVTAVGTAIYFTRPEKSVSVEQTETPYSVSVDKVEEKGKSNPSIVKVNPSPNIVSSSTTSSEIDKPIILEIREKTPEEMTKEAIVINSKNNEEIKTTPIVEEQKIDCSKLNIDLAFTAIASCTDKQDGKILVDQSKIKGGSSPFSYSVNNKHIFSGRNEFNFLLPGNYTLYIKDANNCVVQKNIEVEEKQCKKPNAFAFTPELGKWKIPVKENNQGILKIFNKSGILVYTSEISSDNENYWDGTSSSGQMLEAGYYTYQINYSDGEEEVGSVSIMHQ